MAALAPTEGLFNAGLKGVGLFILLVIPVPLFFVVWLSFTSEAYLRLPPPEYSLKWFVAVLSSGTWMYALVVSLVLAVAVAILTTMIALFAAFATRDLSAGRKGLFNFLVLSPLIFPHAALSIVFFSVARDFGINASFWGALLAHAVICGPFAFRPIAANLGAIEQSQVEAASSLGAGPFLALWRVLLPQMKPGITTSLWFSFIISFDEVNVTMFLVGPNFTTLPVKTYAELAATGDPTIAAMSALLIVFTLIAVFILRWTVGLGNFARLDP